MRIVGRTAQAFYPAEMPCLISRLSVEHVADLHDLSTMFGVAFGDPDSYTSKRPSDAYLRQLLASETYIALAAYDRSEIVGGLVAYELQKFEQERSEIYIYDLAVLSTHRRRGIATALIEQLKVIGASRGAWVIFVQADTDEDDAAAIALYTKLGAREDVLHFDINVETVQ